MVTYEQGDKCAEWNFTIDLSVKLTRLGALASAGWHKIKADYIFIKNFLLLIKRSHPGDGGYHSTVVKKFKSLQDETALNDIGFLALAVEHGVLHLSDYELLKLVEGNRLQQDHTEEPGDWEFVQVTGCKRDKDNDSEVIPFVSHSEAEFYGLYIGKPGAYRFIDDCPTYPEAMHAAAKYVESGEAKKISDKTFHSR